MSSTILRCAVDDGLELDIPENLLKMSNFLQCLKENSKKSVQSSNDSIIDLKTFPGGRDQLEQWILMFEEDDDLNLEKFSENFVENNNIFNPQSSKDFISLTKQIEYLKLDSSSLTKIVKHLSSCFRNWTNSDEESNRTDVSQEELFNTLKEVFPLY